MTDINAGQIDYWNEKAGHAWVSLQDRLDRQLQPLGDAAMTALAPGPGERVLDIGCGAGATTLLLADAVGPAGHVTGLDVSEPMLGLARQRGAGRDNIGWVLADASTHRFAPASRDLLFSRFGVMFFGDPVAAFANLRTALRPGGRLAFVCWRPFDENPWMRVPLHAVYAAGVQRVPKPGPEDPGPYAFADPDRVRRILTSAGWSEPVLTPVDVSLDVAAGGGLEQAVEQATHIGAASRALRDAPEELRPAAIAAIREALAPHVRDENVPLPGAVWVVTSTSS